MEKYLIVYGTSEGYTQKIAEYIARAIRAHGFTVDVRDSADIGAIEESYAGYLIGASVHVGQHQPSVIEFAKRNLEMLRSAPSVFFSVSLSAASPGQEQQATSQQHIDAFIESTGWKPDYTWCIAGALRYSHYGFFKRMLMKYMARRDGLSTDTSTDHEYTDWYALDRMVDYFLANAYHPPTYINTG